MLSSRRQNLLKTFFLNFSPIHRFIISGNSMLPTIQNGSIVLINKFSYVFKNPQIFDIIALKDPRDGKILIKRIQKIENNKYFVAGDNKNASTDSRKFGMIEKKSIIGKVFI